MSTCIVQGTGFWSSPECHDQNSGENAGSGIAGIALQDPSRARQMFDSVLKVMSDPWARRDLARGLAETLTLSEMSKLAETKDGRAMLERALAELKGNHGEAANEWLADQVQATLQMTDLKGNDAFKRLDPANQHYVLTLLGLPWTTTNPTAASNLIALACSAGFGAASPQTRVALVRGLWQNPNSTAFRETLQNLAGEPGFKKLPVDLQVTQLSSISGSSAPSVQQHQNAGKGVADAANNGSAASNAQGVPGGQKQAPWQQVFDAGEEAFKKGQYREAAEAYGASYRMNATPEALYKKAVALEKAGDTKGAQSSYKEYLRMFPKAAHADEVKSTALTHAAFERGKEEYGKKHYYSAAAAFDEAYRVGADPAMLFNKAQALRAAGDFKGALRSYEEFLRRVPDAPNTEEVKARIDELKRASRR